MKPTLMRIARAAVPAVAPGALMMSGTGTASSCSVSFGGFAQALTWDGFVRPRRAPVDPPPLYQLMAARMRQTEHYVSAFAARHGLDRISLTLPGERHSSTDAVRPATACADTCGSVPTGSIPTTPSTCRRLWNTNLPTCGAATPAPGCSPGPAPW